MDALLKAKRRKGSLKPSYKQVSNWLKSQPCYTLHRPCRTRAIKRTPYTSTVCRKDQLWQADLTVLKQFSESNKGNNYVLCVVDVFSKYAWVEPLKRKTAQDVVHAMKTIVERASPRLPDSVMTDKGGEFVNSTFRNYVSKTLGKNVYTSQNEVTKCAVVERFQKTLKNRLWRYLSTVSVKDYTSALPAIVRAYNNSYHRSIGTAPSRVRDAGDEIRVWDRLKAMEKVASKTSLKPIPPNTPVRISLNKGNFGKGYQENWSMEIFYVVCHVKHRRPTAYKIKDYAGKAIKGTFYREELQIVDEPEQYDIEKELKYRRNKATGKKEVLVRWKGYPKTFDQWIPCQSDV